MENIGRSQKGQGNQGLKNNIDETGEKEKVDMESDFKTRVWTGASRDFFFFIISRIRFSKANDRAKCPRLTISEVFRHRPSNCERLIPSLWVKSHNLFPSFFWL